MASFFFFFRAAKTRLKPHNRLNVFNEYATNTMWFEHCSLQVEENTPLWRGERLWYAKSRLIFRLLPRWNVMQGYYPNVPIEISSLSIFDAGWAAQIKRLASMRSTLHKAERLHSGVSSLWGAVKEQQGHAILKSLQRYWNTFRSCFFLI